MKRSHRLLVIPSAVAVVAFGSSWAAISIDPWTGEGDGSVGIKFLTVPLALLGLPFLVGMTLAGADMGNEGKDIAGLVLGGLCHFAFFFVMTSVVMRLFADGKAHNPPGSDKERDDSRTL